MPGANVEYNNSAISLLKKKIVEADRAKERAKNPGSKSSGDEGNSAVSSSSKAEYESIAPLTTN